MKGQQGIGTILILISIVLAAVIASILVIQSANELKTEALNVQKEQVGLITDRIVVKSVEGVATMCGNDPCVTHLIVTASLASGSTPFDLRKTYMGVVTYDAALEGISYVKPEDLYQYSDESDPERDALVVVNNIILDENDDRPLACKAELINVMKGLASRLGTPEAYDITYIARVMDPFPLEANAVPPDLGTIYTVLWTECGGKGDTQTLLPDQEIKIFYRLRDPLSPSEEFTLKIGLARGTPTVLNLKMPRGFSGKIVQIYP